MRSSPNWASLALAIALCAACTAQTRDYDHTLHAFGTYVSVSFYGVTAAQDRNALDNLESFFAEVGQDWYPWAPGELQRINTAIAAGEDIVVSDALQLLILAASDYELISRGHFNAGVGKLTELWGFHELDKPRSDLPDNEQLTNLRRAAPALKALHWRRNVLSSRNNEVMIDLGGIAKGAILEACRELLQASGIDNAIVNIGGDLLVVGAVDGRAARIGIRSPLLDSPIAGLNVASGESVFTSGTYERYVDIGGTRYAHILDPATGFPVQHTVSVTVVADDAQRADAAATALLVGGAAAFDDLVARFGLDYALLIDASGDTRLTPAMEQRLEWTHPGSQQ